MGLTREQAEEILDEWVDDPKLVTHSRCVQAVMEAAAVRYGPPDADATRWGLAGLLHDADWQRWPDEHPERIVDRLRALGDDELADAIRTHNTAWGEPRSAMGRALLACDEVTGFVMACAAVRPEGLDGLTVAAVLRKLRRPTFAAGVERPEVDAGAAAVGVGLDEHIEFVITALRSGGLA